MLTIVKSFLYQRVRSEPLVVLSHLSGLLQLLPLQCRFSKASDALNRKKKIVR